MVRYLLLLASAGCVLTYAQPRVIAENLHERVIAVVPIIGAGTYADPKRPLFAPAPQDLGKEGSILSFSWQPSDDGLSAVVELVATDRKALKAVLTDARVLKVFEKGKDKREDVERELKRYRKDFSVDKAKSRIEVKP